MSLIPWWHTEIGDAEKAELLSAFGQEKFSQGKIGQRLEAGLAVALGARHVVLTNSGTSALTMALLAASVGPGDEVIVPALTWVATAQAAALLGARAVLADCMRDEPIVDPDDVQAKVTAKTKAIIPVHLNGRCCDLDALRVIARAAGAVLIEDTCKAMMSRSDGACLGTQSDYGCFSLGMISLLSVGYGGFIVTPSLDRADKLRLIRDHGVIREPEQYAHLGSNYKVSDLLAAIGLGQLSRLQEKIEHLRQVYRMYREGLVGMKNLQVLPVDLTSGRLPTYVEIYAENRTGLVSYLLEHGVQTSAYHLPLSHATYLEAPGRFANSERWARGMVIPPSGPSQSLENVATCVRLLRDWCG